MSFHFYKHVCEYCRETFQTSQKGNKEEYSYAEIYRLGLSLCNVLWPEVMLIVSPWEMAAPIEGKLVLLGQFICISSQK